MKPADAAEIVKHIEKSGKKLKHFETFLLQSVKIRAEKNIATSPKQDRALFQVYNRVSEIARVKW